MNKVFFSLLLAICCLGARPGMSAQPEPGSVLWSQDLVTGAVAPSVGPDGTIYVGGVTNWEQSGLLAVTNSIAGFGIKWNFICPWVTATAVARDGTIYVATQDVDFYALNPDGTKKWAYTFQSYGSSPPAIGLDNTVYVVGDDSLYALSPAGEKKWAYRIWGHTATPSLGPDGTIYVRNDQVDATLYAIDPQGVLKWSAAVSSASEAKDGPAIGPDGTIYLAGSVLSAFAPDGRRLGLSQLRDLSSSPTVGPDGTIYVEGTAGGTLYALTPAGAIAWQASTDWSCVWKMCWPTTTPAVDAAGMVYQCTAYRFMAFSPAGQLQWTVADLYIPAPVVSSSPAITTDGIIITSISNRLYGIMGSAPPPQTGWPMYRQNARRTGKVERPFLQSSVPQPDLSCQLKLYGQLGGTFRIETSTNLSSWKMLTDISVTSVPMEITDSTASNSPVKFYRAVER